MAVRSGAGTGVIVSLVIFIIMTICMLVMSIVFYSGQTKALEAETEATAALDIYARSTERSSDRYRTIEQDATKARKSVAAHLVSQRDDITTFISGTNNKSLVEMQADFAQLGVNEGSSVRDALVARQREVRGLQGEIDGLEARLADRDSQIAEKDAQLDRQRDDHQAEVDSINAEIDAYRQASERYRQEVSDTVARMEKAIEEVRVEYEDRLARRESELDMANQELGVVKARLEEFESIMNETRLRAQNPALLVDAQIIDVDPANDLVFVNRGRADRVVLGMTFEVYDDAASITPNADGIMPRGKASLQVSKVGPNTATCKVTRSISGRPIVRNDVVANAVYDPHRRLKFMVHGKFDVDLDGRPTDQEASHLRSQIIDWGGEVVEGDRLPGDLDFLVMGAEPPLPRPLPADATAAQIDAWVIQREAKETYDALFERASEAQIPVLNANRFFILIGK